MVRIFAALFVALGLTAGGSAAAPKSKAKPPPQQHKPRPPAKTPDDVSKPYPQPEKPEPKPRLPESLSSMKVTGIGGCTPMAWSGTSAWRDNGGTSTLLLLSKRCGERTLADLRPPGAPRGVRERAPHQPEDQAQERRRSQQYDRELLPHRAHHAQARLARVGARLGHAASMGRRLVAREVALGAVDGAGQAEVARGDELDGAGFGRHLGGLAKDRPRGPVGFSVAAGGEVTARPGEGPEVGDQRVFGRRGRPVALWTARRRRGRGRGDGRVGIGLGFRVGLGFGRDDCGGPGGGMGPELRFERGRGFSRGVRMDDRRLFGGREEGGRRRRRWRRRSSSRRPGRRRRRRPSPQLRSTTAGPGSVNAASSSARARR